MIREATVWVRPDRPEDRFLPEGPRAVTLAGRPAVLWVNIQTAADATAGALCARFWDTGEVRRFDLPDRPGFALPTDRPDVVLVGAGNRLLLVNPLTGKTEELATIPDDGPRTLINDGEVDVGGRSVVFGTKDVRFADPIGHLYRFDIESRRLTVLARGMTCSNGKVVVPGALANLLADIDTPRRRIDLYADYGRRAEWVRSVDLSAEAGFPDGMCLATDGTVIVAFYNPEPAAFGRAVRFDLDSGERLGEWRTPGSPRVTCPLVVATPGGAKLILTTAVEGMPADQLAGCPNAGCLFLADADGLMPAADVVRVLS
jgi:sugar lactone lactonase YvrE